MSFDTITDIYARELNGDILGTRNGRIYQFGFTRPDSSNSGAVALITMAYEFFAKDRRATRSACRTWRTRTSRPTSPS
jgi:hypothetical protein